MLETKVAPPKKEATSIMLVAVFVWLLQYQNLTAFYFSNLLAFHLEHNRHLNALCNSQF